MNENTKIISLLGEGHLYDTLQLLKPLALKTSDFRLTDRLQSIEQNYRFLIEYFASGVEDNDREHILQQLYRQTFILYDDIRKSGASQSKNLLMMQATAADYKPQDNKYSHLREIFYSTWLGTRANDNLLVTDEEKNIYISALMLNIIGCFSEEKTIGLCKLAAYYKDEPQQRALVAMLMVLHHYRHRIKFFPEICSILQSIASDDRLRLNIKHIIIQLLNTSLSPAIAKEMENLSKDLGEQADKEHRNIIIALEDNDETKPEWGETVRSLFDQHIENVSRLHSEGGDMNYSSTRPLLGNSFFTRDIANWFLPFGFDNTETGIDFSEENTRLLKGILLSNTEACDIDRYAICTIFTQLQQQLRNSKLPSVIEDMNQFGDIETMTENYSEENMSLNYVRTLYRFFKHNTWNIDNLMDDITHTGGEYACRILINEAESGEIADRCLRLNLYEEDIEILSNSNSLSNLQKKGYALQKTGNYKEAIKVYDHALLYEEDKWTLSRKAYCLLKQEEYELALNIYNKLLGEDKDNKKLLLNKAQCLMLLDRMQDALEVFFHLDLLYPGNTNTERGLAWCAFVTATAENDNYRLAEQYMERIVYGDNADMNDRINYGHLLLATGHLTEAISSYRQAASGKENTVAFLKQMKTDMPLLLKKGISEENFNLITESVRLLK